MERLSSENVVIFKKLQAIIYAATDGRDECLYNEEFIELSSKAQDFDKELKLALIAQIKAAIKRLPPRLKENPPKSSLATSADILRFYLNILQKNPS